MYFEYFFIYYLYYIYIYKHFWFERILKNQICCFCFDNKLVLLEYFIYHRCDMFMVCFNNFQLPMIIHQIKL